MVIPYYWAESRLQHKHPSRQITVRRRGWSDISQQDAQELADHRVQEAMARIESGEKLRRREPKEAYDCADDIPIREEVVSRHENGVITRNSYGSLCLNTPDVFFADVDASPKGMLHMSMKGCLVMLIASAVAGLLTKSPMAGFSLAIGLPWLVSSSITLINKRRLPKAEARAKEEAMTAIQAFSAAYPAWHLRVYETPAGYRLLAMHDLFEPTGETAKKALEALNADKRFARLCAVQRCFRARVSPKHWRMKYKVPLSLPKSKWPFPNEHVPLRQQWIEAYNQHAPKYASCRFITALGSGIVHPEAEAVRALHDAYCRAQSDLPLA